MRNDGPMILVGQFDSPFARRVAVVLHHYRMPFTRDTRSIFGDAQAIQKINPLIRIPTLILDSGEVLIDSGAIIDHLDEAAGPALALMPPRGQQRRRTLQATALASGAADKAGAIVYERFFHPAQCVSREWEQRCLGQLSAALGKLEEDCGAPWFFGVNMSHADVMVGCMIGYLKLRLPEAFPADRFPRLQRLADHCEMREEFVEARIGADEKMPAK
jgi:glutathione S-transferase